ncbi:hypothetical protein RND71_016010 [Anisodus tanguticus]|uniref:Uncharacterized protein n=1 Tax=Anisodus tanguticus TaxID=243964 RepID=A0AAE1S853_9SOLA|nr:hypothetical protein RND71_016010 [Anisodus tanguticus]
MDSHASASSTPDVLNHSHGYWATTTRSFYQPPLMELSWYQSYERSYVGYALAMDVRVLIYIMSDTEEVMCGNTKARGNGLESGNEWERLLQPFDFKQLQRSLNKITPYQLNKLLALPLDVPTSMVLFQWASSQTSYCHSFDVYYTLIDKLEAAKEFKIIDQLLL